MGPWGRKWDIPDRSIRPNVEIPNESLLKRQRIYSADNNTASEHVRVFKRTLNNAALPVSKSSRYSGQPHLLNLLKRDPPESFDKPLTKRRKILKLRKRKRFRRTSTYQMHVSGSYLFKKKWRQTMPSDPTESNTSKTPRSYTDSPQSFRALSKVKHKLANNQIITKKDRLLSGIFPKTID